MSTSSSDIPTVSYVGEDRTLVELLYDPGLGTTALAVARPTGEVTVENSFGLPNLDRLTPYGPRNSLLANGCVLLPSEIVEPEPTEVLVQDLKTFLDRHVALSAAFRDIAVYYVLLSWVYDAFGELPYLRFRGDYGTGKTRALMTIGSLCYKPFFASGASTVSPIFHVLDVFRGTLILDEADFRFSDATAELTKILNNGNADGLPLLRTMTNRHRELNPRAFKVFGPKIIGMRHGFSDDALESRFLTEDTVGQRDLTGIPIHLPSTFHCEARAFRNRLLAWRFSQRFAVQLKPERALPHLEPRLNQVVLALLSVIEDEAVRDLIADEVGTSQSRSLEVRASSAEGVMVSVLLAALKASPDGEAPVGIVTARYNARMTDESDKQLTARGAGSFLRQRLRLAPMKKNGVYVVSRSELPKLRALAKRYGVGA